jgi:hypothetical protein
MFGTLRFAKSDEAEKLGFMKSIKICCGSFRSENAAGEAESI